MAHRLRGKASSTTSATASIRGFLLGSGVLSDGTLTEVTAGCHTMLFDATSIPPGDPTCVSSGETTIHNVGEFGFSDIGSSGHIEFLPGQAHVFTDDTSSEALVAGYVAAPGTKLGDAFVVDWTGTGIAPSAQIVLSDGSLGGASRLVFEAVYGGDDLWLTNNSSQELKDNAPDTSGGSGSARAWYRLRGKASSTTSATASIRMGLLGSGVLSDWHPHRGDSRLPHHAVRRHVDSAGHPRVCRAARRRFTTSASSGSRISVRLVTSSSCPVRLTSSPTTTRAGAGCGYVAAPGTKLGDAFVVDWTGTGIAPSAQIVLSDGTLGGASKLVFEAVYGADDLW